METKEKKTRQTMSKALGDALAEIDELKDKLNNALSENENLKDGIIVSNEQLKSAKEELQQLRDKEKKLRADYSYVDANWAAALRDNHNLKMKVERLQGRSLLKRILNR